MYFATGTDIEGSPGGTVLDDSVSRRARNLDVIGFHGGEG
jgi:hypothetical protein